MAYFSFDIDGDATSNFARAVAPTGLSLVERSVVRLSLQDSRRSLRPLSRVGRVLQAIFGTRPTTRLADARLEALRRYAVTYRTMRRSSKRGLEVEAGISDYGSEAVTETRRIVDAHLDRLPRRNLNTKLVVGLLVTTPVVLWMFTVLTRELGDPLISAILVGVGWVTAASLARPQHGPR